MSKKDKLLKEIEILKDKRKDWFNVLFALASAIIVLVYSVLSGDKPIYVLVLGILGFIGLLFVTLYYKEIENDIENKLSQLEEED